MPKRKASQIRDETGAQPTTSILVDTDENPPVDQQPTIQETDQQPTIQESKFQINSKYTVILHVDREALGARSTLLKGLFESCEFNSGSIVKLQLERPEKFSVLLYYLETGKKAEELENYNTFASYINDAVYMGMEDLLEHLQSLLTHAIEIKKADLIDFSQSQPNYDFMVEYLDGNEDLNNFGLCQLVMNWVGNHDVYRSQVQELVYEIDFNALEIKDIKYFIKRYPESFDVVLPASVVFEEAVQKRVKCSKCCQMVAIASIDKDPCYTTTGTYFKRDGIHKLQA